MPRPASRRAGRRNTLPYQPGLDEPGQYRPGPDEPGQYRPGPGAPVPYEAERNGWGRNEPGSYRPEPQGPARYGPEPPYGPAAADPRGSGAGYQPRRYQP